MPETASERKGVFWEILRPTLVLISICVAVAGLLALTYHAAGIRELEAAGLSEQQLADALPQVLPGGTLLTPVETSYESVDFLGLYQDEGGAGAALLVKSKGYGGDVKLLVGFSPEGSITGISVVSHSETPGLGTRALTKDYLSVYTGRTGEQALTSEGGEIDGVAGATYTSRAAVRAVTAAASAYEQVKGDLR